MLDDLPYMLSKGLRSRSIRNLRTTLGQDINGLVVYGQDRRAMNVVCSRVSHRDDEERVLLVCDAKGKGIAVWI